MPGPRRWLRLETIGFALPPWAGTHPYQTLPFQWSCDLEAAPGHITHLSYLAPAGPDPRRALAESLVQGLGTSGPLLAYNAGFERNRIRELADRFEDLAEPLAALLPRIVDLFALLRDHAYHPAMAGGSGRRGRCSRPSHPRPTPTASTSMGMAARCRPMPPALQPGVPAAQAARWRPALEAHGRRHCAALRELTRVLESPP